MEEKQELLTFLPGFAIYLFFRGQDSLIDKMNGFVLSGMKLNNKLQIVSLRVMDVLS